MAMGGGAITERDPNATTDRNPKRTMHAMVRAHRSIFAPPENPAPAKIFDLPIHCLRQPVPELGWLPEFRQSERDRKSTRLNSSHGYISYAVFCLKKKKIY